MFKRIIPFGMLIMLFLLTSCSETEKPSGKVEEKQSVQTVTSMVPQLQPAENEVLISRNLGFGQINPRIHIKLEGEESVETFREADRTKYQLMGVMDVRHPDFDLVFINGGEVRELHLWLPDREEQRGMVTEIDNTGTGYELTPKSTQILRGLIEDYHHDY